MINAVEDALIDRVDVHRLMDQLPARDFLILRSRFGFNGPEQTFDDMAQLLHISRSRVMQLQNRALRRMRRVMRGQWRSLGYHKKLRP